jgi:hypothetical protein
MHTEECLKLQGQYEEKREQYKRQYPNYCRSCEGHGFRIYSENMSPLGSGRYWPMYLAEICIDCLGLGKCPACMQPVFSYEDTEKMDGSGKMYCEQCGWVDDEKHGMPEEWDCWGCQYEMEEDAVNG